MTAAARVPFSWARYSELARNVTAPAPAPDRVPTRSTTTLASPCSSQPNRAASSPRVAAIDQPLGGRGGPYRLRGAGVVGAGAAGAAAPPGRRIASTASVTSTAVLPKITL